MCHILDLQNRYEDNHYKTTHSGSNIGSNIDVTYAKNMMWRLINEERDKLSNIASYSYHE